MSTTVASTVISIEVLALLLCAIPSGGVCMLVVCPKGSASDRVRTPRACFLTFVPSNFSHFVVVACIFFATSIFAASESFCSSVSLTIVLHAHDTFGAGTLLEEG
jgi:hypothetical protein